MPDDLLTSREVAAMLRVSLRTIEDWRRKKRGPRWVAVGPLVRYSRADVAEYIEQNTVAR